MDKIKDEILKEIPKPSIKNLPLLREYYTKITDMQIILENPLLEHLC